MFPVVEHLGAALEQIATTTPEVIDQLVCIEASPEFPGQLIFQPMGDAQVFLDRYGSWLSRYLILNEQFNLRHFVAELGRDGFCPIFAPNTAPILADHQRWGAPLPIDGLHLTKADGSPSQLFDYQRFTLNRALERAVRPGPNVERLTFFGWGAGAGKSIAAAAGTLELFSCGEIEVAFVFTLRRFKYNLRDFFTDKTPLTAVVNDGTTERRARRLADPGIQVFVNNFDKALWDHDAIIDRIGGRRTLFVFDEVQKILAEEGSTKVRTAMESVLDSCEAIIWPMSASVVNHSPFRYRDTYQLGSGRRQGNPLGTKIDFEKRYVEKKTTQEFQTKHGGRFSTTYYTWRHDELQEVRHRVAHCTQNARKTDPGVRENFKGIDVLRERVQLSDEDRRLYDALLEMSEEARRRDESGAPYLQIARYICNAPAALGLTESQVGQRLARAYPKLITNAHSAKVEMFCDKVQSIFEAGDKVIAFTKWTSMTLHLLAEELTRREIPHVKHFGVGMTDREGYAAQRTFAEDPAIPLFLSSDAGAYGLNMQMCRFVLQYECPHTYDRVMQRNARIDRADSHLDGLTSYLYVTDATCEAQIYRHMLDDQKLVEATTGAREALSYGDEDDNESGVADAFTLLLGGEK